MAVRRLIRRLVIVAAIGAFWAAPAHAATWCGPSSTTDRFPQLFGGDDIHVVYAVPADGTDRLDELANAIETDVETIDTWWRGQDPTRAPRFDLFQFPCGPQADITTVRLPESGAQLPSADVDFTRIYADLGAIGLLHSFRVALVYYDGPVTEPFCGTGGESPAANRGLAIVFVNACARTRSEWTAAHELITALGGVPVGAPHRCPGRADTCDSSQDVMNEFIPSSPLSAAILDPGHDDYYAHSGSWPDIQDSPYLKDLQTQARLSVTIAGAGTVVSDVQGIDCTASCATDWNGGSTISLSAMPGKGLRFVRWAGACAGHGACALTLEGPTSVSALFAPRRFRLSVSIVGRGTVTSRPRGISCTSRCKSAFTSYQPVRLTARPAPGWRLKSWAAACRGTRAACSVPMKAPASARAVFVRQ
jgi:Divergent InlB B-repeat domain